MKINGKTVKVIFAVVIIVGSIFWAIDSVRTRSYVGTNLNFDVGSGPITVTNPSNESIPVQLIGAGSTAFRVSSNMADVAGNSTRQGSGRNSTYLFELELPPSTNEITVVRGADVKFVTNTETQLEAIVEPLSADQVRATLIAAGIVILGALYYISTNTGHQWINLIRGRETSDRNLNPSTESTSTHG